MHDAASAGRLLPLAFITLFLSIAVVNAECSPPINVSVGSVRAMPEDFIAFSCSMLPSRYASSGCLGVVSDSCIPSFSTDTSSMFSSLSASEYAAFRTAVRQLNDSASYVFMAKSEVNEVTDKCSFSVLDYASLVTNPNNPKFTQCIVYAALFQIYASDIVMYEQRSLELANSGLNSALETLRSESDQLYCEGGGYGNYSSSAFVTYNKVKDFISRSKLDFADGIEDADIGMKWSVIANKSWALNREFSSSGASGCQVASVLNSELGPDSVFIDILSLYREVKDIREKLRNEYIAAQDSADSTAARALAAQTEMKGNDYLLVDSDIVLLLQGMSQRTTLQPTVVPAQSLDTVSDYLSGVGDEFGAVRLKDEARSVAKDTSVEFRYAVAIAAAKESEAKSNLALQEFYNASAVIDSLLSSAENVTAAKRLTAMSAVQSFSAKNSVEDALKQEANSILAAAEATYQTQTFSKGQRIAWLVSASEGYDEAANLISDEKVTLANKIDDLNTSLNLLQAAMKNAAMDDVDTTAEKAVLDSKRALIQSMSFENAAAAMEEAESAVAAIYAHATDQYSSLPAQREFIVSIIDVLGSVEDVTSLKKEIASFERYVYEGSFVPERTLGHYKQVKNKYNEVEGRVSRQSIAMLQNYLPRKARVNKVYTTTPIIGSMSEVSTAIEVINDLPLNTTSGFSIKIPKVPINSNSNITVDPSGLRVASYADGIEVFFPGIAQMSSSTVGISTPFKMADLASKTTKRLSFTSSELMERTEYSLNVAETLDTLLLIDNSSADVCEAYLNGMKQGLLFTDGTFTARLSSVQKGSQKLTVACMTFNPIEVIESNSTGSGKNVDYLLSVRSKTPSVEDVPMTLTLPVKPAMIVSDSIRVSDPSGAAPRNFSYSISGGNYVLKWRIPILSRSFQVYRVFYTTTDIAEYYNELKSQVSNYSKDENIDIASHIRDADYRASTGDYAGATESLHRAQRAIDSGRNERLQREAVAMRLDDASMKLSSLENASSEILEIASLLGMPDAAFQLNKQLASFKTTHEEAVNFLAANNTAAALSAVKSLEKMAESSGLESAFYKKQESLFKMLSKQQSTAFVLSSYGDITDVLDSIDSVRVSLKNVSPLISSSQYAPAAALLSNISGEITMIDLALSNRTDDAVKESSSVMVAAKKAIADWKSDRNGIIDAVKISSDNPGRRIDTKTIYARINKTDSDIENMSSLYDKVKQYGRSDIISKMDEFRGLRLLMEDSADGIRYLAGLRDSYKSSALSSIDDARKILEMRLGNATTQEEKDTLLSMQPLLSSAKGSYDSGLYLNSVLLTEYVRDRATGYESVPAPIVDPFLLYLAVVVIASAAIVMILFKKDEPKGPRIIERVKLD